MLVYQITSLCGTNLFWHIYKTVMRPFKFGAGGLLDSEPREPIH